MTDTRMPSGSVPQYDNFTPMFPKNSISNHVAGNVAIKKTTNANNKARITFLHPFAARLCADVPAPGRGPPHP